LNRDVTPLDDATPDVIPLDDQPDVIPLDEPKPTLSKVEDAIKNGWSALKEGWNTAAQADAKLKKTVDYDTNPIGLSDKVGSAIQSGFLTLAEKTSEGLTKKFPNHSGAAVAAGVAVGLLPDAAMLAIGDEGGIENTVPNAGLTSVGEKIAQNVAKTESVAPIADSVIKLPTGEVKVLDTSKLPQPLVAKLEQSKQVAANLEGRVTKATNALEDFTKNGTDGLSISAREQEWTNRLADMKAEHADLRRQVQVSLFDNNMEPKSKAYVDKLSEMQNKKDALAKQYDELTPIGPKEQKILDGIAAKRTSLQNELRDASTANYADQAIDRLSSSKLTEANGTPAQAKLDKVQAKMNVLDLIEQKAHQQFQDNFQTQKQSLAQSINKAETDITDLGRTFGSQREKSLIAMRDKANTLEADIAEMEAKYRLHRMDKFNKQKDKLTEIAAYAENDLRNLGFTSKDIQDGFVKFVRGDVAGSRMVNMAKQGNVISKDLYDGLVAAPDMSGFEYRVGQFTTNFDQLDKLTKGAWSREIKQDLYNKSIQSYEISNHFLQKVNSLMEKHGLTDADGHTFTRYVEGEISAPPGREAAFAAAKEDMRLVTDEALDLRNARRVQRGEEPIARRDNYITSAQEQSLKDDLYVPAKEAMKSQYAKKKTAEFGFDQHRQDLIPEDMRIGAFDVIKMYTTKTAREVSLSDSVEKLRALAEVAQKSKKPNMANYFNSVADRITGEAFTNAVKGMNTAISSPLLSKMMELGGNYAANVVNQIGAGINQINSVMLASKDIGVGRAILSVPSGFATELKEQILKATSNPAYESFATENSKVLRLVQARETAQALRTAKKYGPLASVNDWIFKYFNDSLYKGVFNQSYKAARNSGYAHSVAVKVADAVVEKSQGIFEDALKPAIISSHHPLLQLAAPLQTAVMNTFNVLKNDVVFAKLSGTEKAATVGRMVATGAATNAMIALATGKKTSAPDAIPFFRMAQLGIGGIFSPLAKLAQGKPGQAVEQALLMTPQMRMAGGLQTMKTVKGAAQLIKGDTIDPRVLIFGPKPKEKSGD
jgi:hypothetical protein